MSTLIEDAQKHIERLTQDLSGDEDFMPFMTIRDHSDRVIYAGLMMPGEEDGKDQIANFMTALCMVHRGVEAVFASVTWMVTAKPGENLPNVMPSQHPDRVEMAFLIAMDTEEHVTTHSAPLIRENNMVGVGLWSEADELRAVGGRFGDAMRHGLALAKKLPPEMAEWLDHTINEDSESMSELVNRFAETIGEAREQSYREQLRKQGLRN
jgi:hypothetical protein